jgi:hypothetical protein
VIRALLVAALGCLGLGVVIVRQEQLRTWRIPMNGTGRMDRELFDGGPPLRLQRSLGLITPDAPRRAWRAVLTVLVGWVPLAVLAAAQGRALSADRAGAWLLDFGVHARLLIAAPLFILAESVCLPRLGSTVRHFLDAGLVTATDRPRFDAIVTSTQRLRDALGVVIVAVLLAYAMVVAVLRYAPLSELPSWHLRGDSGGRALSLAGWWHVLVSQPLLLVLGLGWLWRLALWGRCRWRLSRLDLQLVPARPDQMAGLKFVGYSVRAFALLGFALGVIVAGRVAVRVVHTGVSPLALTPLVVGLVVGVVLLCSGPLLVFTGKLLEAWRRGILAYGALASAVGQQFERKWLTRTEAIDAGALEVPDFSATTDLYQIVSNVYQIWIVPLDLKSLGLLVGATLLPFLPVVLTVVPLKAIVAELTHLLF